MHSHFRETGQTRKFFYASGSMFNQVIQFNQLYLEMIQCRLRRNDSRCDLIKGTVFFGMDTSDKFAIVLARRTSHSLVYLELNRVKVADKLIIMMLQRLPNLQKFDVVETQMGNEGLKCILQTLNLVIVKIEKNPRITDDGYKMIAKSTLNCDFFLYGQSDENLKLFFSCGFSGVFFVHVYIYDFSYMDWTCDGEYMALNCFMSKVKKDKFRTIRLYLQRQIEKKELELEAWDDYHS